MPLQRVRKYHTADCKLSGDADGMTLAAAKKAGKTACACASQMPYERQNDSVFWQDRDGTRCNG